MTGYHSSCNSRCSLAYASVGSLAWYDWKIEKVMEQKDMLQEIAGFDMAEYRERYCMRKKTLTDRI